jgi:hypothetical protein
MSQRLLRLVVSHPANVISIAALFGVLLVAFAVIETRLTSDGLPAYVRHLFGFGLTVLFAYTAVVGVVYLVKRRFANAAACLLTAGALYASYLAAQGAGYDIMDCKVRFETASEIDWQRPFINCTRKLAADDIEIEMPKMIDLHGQSFSLPFYFKIPEYRPRIMAAVDYCGNVEVW